MGSGKQQLRTRYYNDHNQLGRANDYDNDVATDLST
jgi:hypothetical protein